MVLVNFWRYPDPYQRFLIRIRIRPNYTDPTGSGSGSETLVKYIFLLAKFKEFGGLSILAGVGLADRLNLFWIQTNIETKQQYLYNNNILDSREDPVGMLPKEACLEALAELRHAKWFTTMAVRF